MDLKRNSSINESNHSKVKFKRQDGSRIGRNSWQWLRYKGNKGKTKRKALKSTLRPLEDWVGESK